MHRAHKHNVKAVLIAVVAFIAAAISKVLLLEALDFVALDFVALDFAVLDFAVLDFVVLDFAAEVSDQAASVEVRLEDLTSNFIS